MSSETTFRKTLIDELTALVNSRELDERFIQMEYVEDKLDITGEYLDFYTDDVLRYESFVGEFATKEIEALRGFIHVLETAEREKTAWSTIQARAASLLALLGERCNSKAGA